MTEDFNWFEEGDVGISFAVEESEKMLAALTIMDFNPVPIGLIHPFGASSAPDGYLLCDGASYASVDYPELFAVIGYSFGGSGSDFNVPTLINRVAVGSGDLYDVAAVGGEAAVTLDTSTMPSHSHSDLGHSHTYTPPGTTFLFVAPGEAPGALVNLIPSVTGTGFASIQPTGDGEAHNNMQPFQAVTYIIYAGR